MAEETMLSEIGSFIGTYWNNILDFTIILVCIYWVLYFVRGTKSANTLIGIGVLLAQGFILAKLLELTVLTALLGFILNWFPILLLFVFQSELRRVFAQAGSFFIHAETSPEMVDEVIDAVFVMSRTRTGALIVIERNIGLANIINSSVTLDAKVKSLLLQSLFYKNSTLHDGAVIIRKDTIVAARAILPLTQEGENNPVQKLGTRHRAAIGITEETDAVAVTVSEETGAVSVEHKGRIMQMFSRDQLHEILDNLLQLSPRHRKISFGEKFREVMRRFRSWKNSSESKGPGK